MKISTTLAVAALATVAATALALPAQAAPNVSVSIGINAPGQYGRIDINNYPQPVLVREIPIVYAPTPVAVYQSPIYLYVPQAHQANWGRYCGSYRACGQPVYFVQEQWVREQYRQEHDRRDDRRHDRYDRRDERRDDRRNDRPHDNRNGDKHGRDKHRN